MFDIVIKTDKGKLLDRIRCNARKATLGKGRDNLVQLRGWRIAPIHAQVEQTEKGIYIENRSDAAGTILVNGVKADHYGPLRASDEIAIGSYRLHVGIAEEDALAERAESEDAAPESVDPLMQTFVGHVAVQDEQGDEQTLDKEALIGNEMRFLWRNRVHQEILLRMDLRRVDVGTMDDDELRANVQKLVDEIITEMSDAIPESVDRKRLAEDVLNEAIGLGPLEDLLADESVTEIMVNAHDDIYIEKDGRLQKSDVTFSSDNAVMSAIERIVSPLGRRIDESSPMVDARLKDGSRVNAIIPPLALRGPTLTIRKFSKKKLTAEDMMAYGSLNEAMVEFLRVAVEQRKNIIIAGGTGSGKTTLLNVMSNFIPPSERVITVEDAAELKLNQPHVVSLEARPPNVEGKGAIPIRELVKNCLRMRPDRIVVGECRGGEALDMLQAMNTGHDGSLTTVHANSPRDVIARLEVMVMMAGMELPASAIREQVASAVDLIVQQSRFADGTRKVTHITEVTGVESGVVSMQDIFLYRQEGFDGDGNVVGHFEATGAIPQFYEDLRARGIGVNMEIFR
ncbi:MAG: CpaF family protein [Gammaproteobacteria bacterium]|nr:MAG: CpaF family protein [Gammaproteobacteria bacterium]